MLLTAGNVIECPNWSEWHNWDDPQSGTGDKEIPKEGQLPEHCTPIGTQGRIKETNQTVTTQNVHIDLTGLLCIKAEQIGKYCLDYEIRICCEGLVYFCKFVIVFICVFLISFCMWGVCSCYGVFTIRRS